MPPYPDIFTDDFQKSDQVKFDILTKSWRISREECCIYTCMFHVFFMICLEYYLRRRLLIPVLQNFRQRFFSLYVSSDHGIVWFDISCIWSKCKLYCVPSLRSIIAGWDILFSVFCFSIYFLKAWFLVEKVGFWSSYSVSGNGENAKFDTIYPRLPAVRPPLRGGWESQVTLFQICVHIILG